MRLDSYLYFWTTRQKMRPSWFDDKVCQCEMSSLPRIEWKEAVKFEHPLCCTKCNKWLDNRMRCCKCHEMYYQFFRHPRMGYHHKVGWFCYPCLEAYMPPPVAMYPIDCIKIPPPPEVLPTGTLHTVELPKEVSDRVNSFAEFLKGI